MLKLFVLFIAFAPPACNSIQSPPVNKPGGAADNRAVSRPSPTPPAASAECDRRRIIGLPDAISVPLKFCVDLKRPIDAGEDFSATTPLPGNALKQEFDVPFAALPTEAQQIIRLTSGDEFGQAKFAFYVILSGDDSQPGKRSVKTYRYATQDGKASWDFKRQDKALKLDSAELDSASNTPPEQSSLKTFTLLCSASRAYTLPAAAPAPIVPLALCFDEKKPVDGGEKIAGKPKRMVNAVTLSEEKNLNFDKLPPEVQNIIRLTSGEKYTGATFNLDVLIESGGDTGGKTKSYLYYPGTNLKDNPNWTFKKQNNALKLTQASLAAQ